MLTADLLVARIASLQAGPDARFPTGLFPAYRVQPGWFGYRRADENVFLTACTLFTLQGVAPYVSRESRARIEEIKTRAVKDYDLFQNKDGLATYNFWPTQPSRHFPNGYVFRHFDHFRIPDDIDDTALVYLTQPPGTETLEWLRAKLIQHANGTRQHVRNTFADYQTLRVYSTWFGKTMPIDFDACALSNLLCLLLSSPLPRNQHDTDSLTMLADMVSTGRVLSDPFRCAPHYARSPLILYHLTRLLVRCQPPELIAVRPRLLTQLRTQLTGEKHPMMRLLLSTSLLWLNETPPNLDLDQIERSFSTFHFFIAGLLTAYENPMLSRLASWPLLHLRWTCEAHCWALVAEYLTARSGAANA